MNKKPKQPDAGLGEKPSLELVLDEPGAGKAPGGGCVNLWGRKKTVAGRRKVNTNLQVENREKEEKERRLRKPHPRVWKENGQAYEEKNREG